MLDDVAGYFLYQFRDFDDRLPGCFPLPELQMQLLVFELQKDV